MDPTVTPAAVSTPDPITEWAQLILGDQGPWSVFAIDGNGNRITRTATSPTELATVTRHLADRCDVWVSMATLATTPGPGRRGTTEQMAAIRSLWADIDYDGPGHARTDLPKNAADARRLLDRFPLPPTSTVDTGGGMHAHWALTEPVPAIEAQQLLTMWGAHWTVLATQLGWHIDPVWDITRVMRVPGTHNRKQGGARPVVELTRTPANIYHLSDIIDCLDTPTPPAPAPRLAAVAGYIGPKRPGDDFAARHTCPEVLAAAGWTHHHTDRQTGNEHWTRPGKERRDGSSATVYAADGRAVIWTSSVPGLATRDSLNPYRLHTKLAWHGDFTAAARDLAARGYGERADPDLSWINMPPPPAADMTEATEAGVDAPYIVWSTFWDTDSSPQEWLVHPLIPKGRSVSISAPGGTGKSLLALHVAAAIATGTTCLGAPPQPPVHVLYLDYEMTEDDLRERLDAMGYGPDTDMGHLHYWLLPAIDPLNTDKGAAALVAAANTVDAALVVIDTYSRAVVGEENDATTTLEFYRLTGRALKAAGRAQLRIDHTGKNLELGARGSSAKTQDVDVAWMLTPIEGGVQLRAIKRRMSWVPETVTVDKSDIEQLMWTIKPVDADMWPAGTKAVAGRLDQLGTPVDATIKEAQTALKGGGGVRRGLVAKALRYRRETLEKSCDYGSQNLGTAHFQNTREPSGNRNPKTCSDQPGTVREPWEPRSPAPWELWGVTDKEPPSSQPNHDDADNDHDLF